MKVSELSTDGPEEKCGLIGFYKVMAVARVRIAEDLDVMNLILSSSPSSPFSSKGNVFMMCKWEAMPIQICSSFYLYLIWNCTLHF
jgi:hypothetical protein